VLRNNDANPVAENKDDDIEFKRYEDAVYQENDTILRAKRSGPRCYTRGPCISKSENAFEISENVTNHRRDCIFNNAAPSGRACGLAKT
jgi:hypothetical protein